MSHYICISLVATFMHTQPCYVNSRAVSLLLICTILSYSKPAKIVTAAQILRLNTLTCHRGCWRDYLILKKVILEEKHAHFSRPFIHKPLDSLQTVFRNCCADLLFCLSIDFVHLFFLTSPGACISTTNPLRALTLTCLDCRLINKPQMYKLNLKNLLPFLSIPGLQWLLCPFSAPFSL